jgi:hypothetical protein
MKKPKSERRETALHVRVRESVKDTAERLAKADGRSLANWLERMIEAEAARQREEVARRGWLLSARPRVRRSAGSNSASTGRSRVNPC